MPRTYESKVFEKIGRKTSSYNEEPSRKEVRREREAERTDARKGKLFTRSV